MKIPFGQERYFTFSEDLCITSVLSLSVESKYPSKDDEEKVITRSSQEQQTKYSCDASKAMEI